MPKRMLALWTMLRVAVAVSLAAWGALHLRRWDPYLGLRLPAWSRGRGLILMIAGGFVVPVCGGVLSARRILSTPGERFWPKEFVATGPFGYVRNPMALSWVTLMLGLGLFEASASMILFAAMLFLFLHLIVAFVEEPGLERRFGDSHWRYKQSVNRWIPGFGKLWIVTPSSVRAADIFGRGNDAAEDKLSKCRPQNTLVVEVD